MLSHAWTDELHGPSADSGADLTPCASGDTEGDAEWGVSRTAARMGRRELDASLAPPLGATFGHESARVNEDSGWSPAGTSAMLSQEESALAPQSRFHDHHRASVGPPLTQRREIDAPHAPPLGATFGHEARGRRINDGDSDWSPAGEAAMLSQEESAVAPQSHFHNHHRASAGLPLTQRSVLPRSPREDIFVRSSDDSDDGYSQQSEGSFAKQLLSRRERRQTALAPLLSYEPSVEDEYDGGGYAEEEDPIHERRAAFRTTAPPRTASPHRQRASPTQKKRVFIDSDDEYENAPNLRDIVQQKKKRRFGS